MKGLCWLWRGAVVAAAACVLSGCAPEQPGFIAVGKSGEGRLVAVMVSCNEPADRAALGSLDEQGSPSGPPSAEWIFQPEVRREDAPLVWPLLGPSSRPSGRGISPDTGLPGGVLSLYVQRDLGNGATGVEFTGAEIEALSEGQYVFRNQETRTVAQGDLTAFLNQADCG